MPGGAPPRISVCIPTYNHARFLGEAIDSVLEQTYTDLELVVVDNCSTDDTPAVVEARRARDARIRYVRNPVNLGAQRNLNRCLELATGEYVNILCADDALEPCALQHLLEALEEDPGASLAACARLMVDEDRRPLAVLSFSGRREHLPGGRAIERCLKGGNLIGEPSAVLFRRRDAARGFDLRYRQLIDLEMWIHLLEKGSLAFVPELLCRFRWHPGSETSRGLASLSFVEESRMLLADHLPVRDGRLLLRHCWRMHVAFEVWALQLRGLPVRDAHRTIRTIYPLAPFYLFLPMKALVRGAAIARGRHGARRLERRGGAKGSVLSRGR